MVEPQGAASHHRQLARGLFARSDVCHGLVVGCWLLVDVVMVYVVRSRHGCGWEFVSYNFSIAPPT